MLGGVPQPSGLWAEQISQRLPHHRSGLAVRSLELALSEGLGHSQGRDGVVQSRRLTESKDGKCAEIGSAIRSCRSLAKTSKVDFWGVLVKFFTRSNRGGLATHNASSATGDKIPLTVLGSLRVSRVNEQDTYNFRRQWKVVWP